MLKKNVEVFNEDASNFGNYQYNSTALSCQVSNSRKTKALTSCANLKDKLIIDIGCGDGFHTGALVEAGAKFVYAIDPSNSAIKLAKKRKFNNVKFEVASIYDLRPELHGFFDVVILRGVIHHLSDPQLGFHKASRMGTELLGIEPNGANPLLKIIERTSKYHIEHEEQSYTPAAIDNMLINCGIQKISGRMISLVPFQCPNWMVKVLKVLEPIVEAIPVLRYICCGNYIFHYKRLG